MLGFPCLMLVLLYFFVSLLYFFPKWSIIHVFNFGRKRRPAVLISKVEHINTSDFRGFELVIISDFVHSIDDYVQILTRMARHTVRGALHSFLTTENATLIEQLIEILERCGQAVPDAVRNLCHSISMVEDEL